MPSASDASYYDVRTLRTFDEHTCDICATDLSSRHEDGYGPRAVRPLLRIPTLQPSIPIETSLLFRAKPAGYSDDPSRVAVSLTSGLKLA